MKALLTLGFLLLSVNVQAKVFERCELARVMKEQGMDGFEGVSLANWVCMAQHESHLNTLLTKNFGARITVYGIYQISNEYWCDDGKTPKLPNHCGMPCSDLLKDDITQAIKCAKMVVKSSQGIKSWYVGTLEGEIAGSVDMCGRPGQPTVKTKMSASTLKTVESNSYVPPPQLTLSLSRYRSSYGKDHISLVSPSDKQAFIRNRSNMETVS